MDDVIDYAQPDNQSNELRDKILQVPRQSKAERMPEPEVREKGSLQQHQVVRDLLERSPLATRVEASVRPEFRAGAPPMLPTEHPWINRAAKEFWEELQDEVLMDAEQGQSKAELRWKTRRDDYMDH